MTTAPRLLVVGDLVSDIRVVPAEPMGAGEEVSGRISISIHAILQRIARCREVARPPTRPPGSPGWGPR